MSASTENWIAIEALPDDLQACVRFHGHVCPGLLIGYRAAKAGLEALAAERAGDEELIAVAENDSCAVDAVQVLTGCTFGKGNLFFRDYGKQVFTFAERATGRAVRVSLKRRDVTPAEAKLPEAERRARRVRYLLRAETDDILSVKPCHMELPDEAEIRNSVMCNRCGENVMESRARHVAGQTLCIPCAARIETPASNQNR